MYEVRWTKSALDELAEMWLVSDSSLRDAITAAAAQVDAMLAKFPGEAGESRSDNRRILFMPPLGVSFVVHEPDRRVIVLHVWCYATGSQ
jgi:hypothetical protein